MFRFVLVLFLYIEERSEGIEKRRDKERKKSFFIFVFCLKNGKWVSFCNNNDDNDNDNDNGNNSGNDDSDCVCVNSESFSFSFSFALNLPFRLPRKYSAAAFVCGKKSTFESCDLCFL